MSPPPPPPPPSKSHIRHRCGRRREEVRRKKWEVSRRHGEASARPEEQKGTRGRGVLFIKPSVRGEGNIKVLGVRELKWHRTHIKGFPKQHCSLPGRLREQENK